MFAGIILLVSGIFGVVQGLVAHHRAEHLLRASRTEQLFLFDVAGWGWWNIIIGVLLILTSFALFAGQTWARVVAIILAILSAVGQLLLIPAQPWWSFIIIAIDVLIIYALTAARPRDEEGLREASRAGPRIASTHAAAQFSLAVGSALRGHLEHPGCLRRHDQRAAASLASVRAPRRRRRRRPDLRRTPRLSGCRGRAPGTR